jgi:hypothetical protein
LPEMNTNEQFQLAVEIWPIVNEVVDQAIASYPIKRLVNLTNF